MSLTNDKQYEIQDQLYIITNKTTLARGHRWEWQLTLTHRPVCDQPLTAHNIDIQQINTQIPEHR